MVSAVRIGLAFLVVLLGSSPARAQGCGDPARSPLGFWLGEWRVSAQGQPIGSNRIEAVLGGCLLLEHWRDAAGREGKSVFYRDGALWKQVWVTGSGAVKEKQLIEASDRAVRFQGQIRTDAGAILDRTTLERLPEGRVRQVIEQSFDGGRSWKVQSDLLYEPRATPPPVRH